MSETLVHPPLEPIAEMHGLLRQIHIDGYSDLDALRRFMHLFDDVREIDIYDQLDHPDIGLQFSDAVFDEIVMAYTDKGGSWAAYRFPNVDHVLSGDAKQNLATLENIFNDPSTRRIQSYALAVRQHATELYDADPTRCSKLLANPAFLAAIIDVYDYEKEAKYDDELDIPETWPSQSDNFLYDVLSALGYKYADSYQENWQYQSDLTHDEGDDYRANLLTIAALENKRPGATAYLSEQFGIRHFSRYSADLLARQFDIAGKVERPYGIVLGAAHDHNGAFAATGRLTTKKTIQSRIFEQAKDSHELLVAEAQDAAEFEQRLRHFDNVNGDNFKIDFAMIEGHGQRDMIRLGRVFGLGHYVLTSKFSNFHELFSQRACIALNSCSTGKINGVAQTISNLFNTTVVAPSADAGIKDITFMNDAQGIRLIPEYDEKENREKTIPIVYRNGTPLGPSETTAYLTK